MNFTRKDIYGYDLPEYCARAGIAPELLIQVENAKLKMLRESYERNRKLYHKEPLYSPESERLSDLLVTLRSKITKTEATLERYKREVEEAGIGFSRGD